VPRTGQKLAHYALCPPVQVLRNCPLTVERRPCSTSCQHRACPVCGIDHEGTDCLQPEFRVLASHILRRDSSKLSLAFNSFLTASLRRRTILRFATTAKTLLLISSRSDNRSRTCFYTR
jgi:hypothetical protein